MTTQHKGYKYATKEEALEAQRQQARDYYAKNKSKRLEESKAYSKKYYERNRETILQKRKEDYIQSNSIAENSESLNVVGLNYNPI